MAERHITNQLEMAPEHDLKQQIWGLGEYPKVVYWST